MKGLSKNIQAIIFVLLAFFSYNVADAFLNAIVDKYHFGSIAFYPLLSYLLLLLIFSKALGGIGQVPKTKKLKLHLLRGVFSVLGFVGFIFAIKGISLAQTYTLVLTSPFWVAIVSFIFLKNAIGFHRWIAITFGFIGVLVVLQPSTGDVNIHSFGALLCGATAGFIMMIAKKIGDKEPMVNLVFYPLIVTMIIMAFINIFWKGWETIALEDIVFFILPGIMFLIADICFSKGFTSGDTPLLAPLHYSQIIWGALIGYFFFAEVPTIWTILGAGLIVLSGVYMIYREHKVETETS